MDSQLFYMLRSYALFIAHFAKLCNHLRKIGLHVFIRELTGSDCLVSAAVVFEHQASYIYIAGTV